MEKDNLQQQRPKEAAAQDNIWGSAFDTHIAPTVQPPAAQLTANPAEEGGGGPEGEYEPETVVFDIGGFADPENPGGKGIKVVIPPDLDGPTALLHVVMAMMRVTEGEAKAMIAKEGIQWVDYKQDGQYLDRQGNAVHLLRFRPKYAERTAHEPQSLRPTDKGDLERYKAFKLYLEDHGGDNIRDPYAQYDNFAKGAGFFVDNPPMQVGAANMDGPRTQYEEGREAVVDYVVWERLRAKRESLAAGMEGETGGLKEAVEGLADSLPQAIDLGLMRQYLPDKYYTAWIALHARMILAQGALEQGDPAPLAKRDLGDAIFSLGNWFAVNAQREMVIKHFQFEEHVDRKFSEADAAEVRRLMGVGEFGLDHGRQLLHLYYKLTFALTELVGRVESGPTRMAMLLDPRGDYGGLDMHGIEIENQGKAGTAMLGMLHDHPTARKVHATYYPEAETKDFRQEGEAKGGDDWSEGITLELYLWHDGEAGEWVLEDFSEIDERKENRAKGAADAPVPAALFEELNSKLRFPKGALFYRCPDEASYRIMRTTEPWTVADWLRTVAIAGLMVGLAVASAGTSIPAQVLMIGSAVAMAGAEVADMAEEAGQGMLTTERVIVHSAMIASCILGGTTGAFGIAGKLGKLGATGGKVARVVAGLQAGADGVCVAVFTKEAFEGLEAAADDPEGITFTRLLGFFLQMGMNGLMLYGMKGSALEAAGARELSEEEMALERQLGEEGKDGAATENATSNEAVADVAVTETGDEIKLKFWNEPKEILGRKVYQRDDLFDPNRVDNFGRTNIQRMEQGRSPIGYDGIEVNLHHLIHIEPGPIAEVGGKFHSDNTKVLHFAKKGESFRRPDGRKASWPKTKGGRLKPSPKEVGFDKWKEEYWKLRSKSYKLDH